MLIRYWKKNTKKKSQEESHGDWFCDPIKKAMNDFWQTLLFVTRCTQNQIKEKLIFTEMFNI